MSALMSLSQAARMLGIEHGGADPVVSGVSTDTRTLQPGELFVALRGPRFDAHDYIAQAEAAGAVAVLVERPVAAGIPQLRVPDARIALGRLAAAHRAQFAVPLIGVTGSNGKTTVKEMLAAILGGRGPVLATRGNLNNDIGMPLTLLALRPVHQAAVIEMGANHAGEIAYLTALARPTVALVNNAGPAHLEGFGSIEGVAHAKAEIWSGLGPDGVAVINADDAYAGLWQEMNAARRRIRFGLHGAAEISADPAALRLEIQDAQAWTRFRMHTPDGAVELRLPLAGRHNVMNALAAAAAAHAAGASLAQIRDGLEGMRAVSGRLQLRQGAGGAWIIDDSYNANPASLQAAIEVLASYRGTRWLVLGDMGELGADTEAFHRAAGEQAREAGIERLLATGPCCLAAVRAFGARGAHFASHEDLIAALRAELAPGEAVLVKGSRSARMERVVEALAGSAGGHA